MPSLDDIDVEIVVGALEQMNMLLAAYDHEWSNDDRAIFEEAMKILGKEAPPQQEMA